MSDSYVYIMFFSQIKFKMCYHGNHTWISYRKCQRQIGHCFVNTSGLRLPETAAEQWLFNASNVKCLIFLDWGAETSWREHRTKFWFKGRRSNHEQLVLTFITLTCFRNTSVLTVPSGVKCNEKRKCVSVLRLMSS